MGSAVLAAEEGKGWRSDRGAGVCQCTVVKCMDKDNELMHQYHDQKGCGGTGRESWNGRHLFKCKEKKSICIVLKLK